MEWQWSVPGTFRPLFFRAARSFQEGDQPPAMKPNGDGMRIGRKHQTLSEIRENPPNPLNPRSIEIITQLRRKQTYEIL
jgi:hypothetical protein